MQGALAPRHNAEVSRSEAPPSDKHLGNGMRIAMAIGLLVGAIVGYSTSKPAVPGSGSPVTTNSQNRAAYELCAEGYTVWSREGPKICG